MSRFEVTLTFGEGRTDEFVFATTRRLNGAVAERDGMLAATLANLREHCRDGRVFTGTDATDPNAVHAVALHADGTTVTRTVSFRPTKGATAHAS